MRLVSAKRELVTVTGSTGFVGTHLIPKLTEKYDVTTIDRVDAKTDYFATEKIVSDLCDINDNLIKHFSEFHGILVHLAAARSDTESREIYNRDNLYATENLLNFLNPRSVIGFVHVSSVAAIAGKKIHDSKTEPRKSDDWYRYTKYLQEKRVEDWCKEHNIPFIILLPSAITSEDDEKFNTNVGRLKTYAKFIPIWPQIDVKKSTTSMNLIVDSIMTCCDHISENHDPSFQIATRAKYLLLDKPTMTITETLRSKHGVKNFVKIPHIKSILTYFALILDRFQWSIFIVDFIYKYP